MIGMDELAEAARNADAFAEEHGMEGWAEIAKVDANALHYVAAQRALRAAMLMDGQDPSKLSRKRKTKVHLSEKVADLLPHLTALAMDGIAIGITARHRD